jgi:uncharacterized protein
VISLWSAFVLGLAGSFHCAGMCGPLALALPVTGTTASGFLVGRLVCQLGRIITYCVLGLLFGMVGRALWLTGIQHWLSVTLGVALLLGLLASRRLGLWNPATALIGKFTSRMSGLLHRRSYASLAVLGLLNGLLPCGLVYAACAGAAAAGGPLAGAQYMAAFGAGTVPMMLAISLTGKLLPVPLRLRLRKAVPLSVILVAALLILRGLSIGIPGLHLDLPGIAPSCCHE